MSATSDVRDITPDEMKPYVIRFEEQMSVRERITNVMKLPVPDWLFGRLFARDLFNLVGKTTNPANQFAVEGPKDTSVFVARMPPRFGPAYLHIHKSTWEIFFVMKGTFRVCYGVEGEHVVDLGRYDCISIPPGVARNFENTSDEDGDMLVVIAGAEDATELLYTRTAKADFEQRAGAQLPGMMGMMEAFGLRFLA
jgi:mannose-6-phosphate isomerase-like protein (cupin superfamily)